VASRGLDRLHLIAEVGAVFEADVDKVEPFCRARSFAGPGDLKDGTRVRVHRPSTQEAKPGGGPDEDDLAVLNSLSRHVELILYDARRKVPSTP
jgi:hypothetical protein